ncbi:MAG: histidinol-phosphate transaminase [Gammaproteobacteria bacterium]|nr:MAG: histidinol-phosphate transaminase [Gammaproteobacteria bacterium]
MTLPTLLASKLARPEVVEMVPYQSARRLFSNANSPDASRQKIWLNANEASGPGIYQSKGECLNRYPDFQPENLLSAYSQYCGLDKKNILATRGADEGIELIIRTFCRAYQDSILICPPTYGMYAISAENHGASIIEVPLVDGDGEQNTKTLNIAALKNQVGKAKVVFLCSPGNPVGNLLPQAQIKQVLELYKNSAIVVVDEAYIEFCAEQSVVSWLAQYPNLVVLRTLSKAFALAGLRCGFTLASREIITLLAKVIAPYPISAPVAELASKALTPSGLEQVSVRVQETQILRNKLSQWLKKQQWCQQIFNSDANFILFRTTLKNEIFNALKAQGILIRDQSKQQQLDNCLRISIGSKRELELVKQILLQQFN